MPFENSDFSLALIGGELLQKKQVDAILRCNETTYSCGLTLTHKQAVELANTCTETLKKTGRIEFRGGITDKLIMSFYDSPYLSNDTFEDTLCELIDLFYSFKNEMYDRISDDTLISYMKQSFNGECHGSIELLSSDALPELAEKINKAYLINPFDDMEITND